VAPEPLSPEAGADSLDARSLEDSGLREFMQVHLEPAPVTWPLERWGLEELTLAGLYFQTDVRAAMADVAIAQARERTAGQLKNPTLSALPQRVSVPTAGVSPWLAAVQVNWTIETAGKRGHRRAAARARADAAWLAIPAAAWGLRGRVADALIREAAAAARHALLEQTLVLERGLVELLDGRLRYGVTDQSTVVPYRMALSRMQADAARSERVRLETRARLAAELALPMEALDGATIALDLDAEPALLADVEELAGGAARRAAMLGRADILGLLAEYAASEADLRLELARQVPDLRLGPGYEFDQGANKWGLALSLDLPVLNQNQGGIAEAVARRRSVAARFEALQTRVIAEVDGATASLRGARIELEAARSLVQGARERSRLLENALAAGAADRFAVLSAQLEATTARAVLIDAQEQLYLSASRLEAAIQPDRAFARSLVASLAPVDDEGTMQ
jgi:outer membrane protein TolC